MSKNTKTKPFLKWVGGKTKILDILIKNLPNDINEYHEIFVGGGSMLLKICELNKSKIINAYDINESLIYTYKNLQSKKKELLTEIEKLQKKYEELPFNGEKGKIKVKTLKESFESKAKFYYYQRDVFNKIDKKCVKASALFIFINKTCFRGLYREGPNGFNVPFGNYKKVNIIDKNNIEKIAELIKNVNFECLNFEESLTRVKNNNFVYLDPPYAPENKNSFTSYNKDGFGINSHKKLFKIIKELDADFMMSNHDVKLVRESFKDEKYKIENIVVMRSIDSKNPGKKTKEVIIRNY
jgi:DNA adenine methylase